MLTFAGSGFVPGELVGLRLIGADSNNRYLHRRRRRPDRRVPAHLRPAAGDGPRPGHRAGPGYHQRAAGHHDRAGRPRRRAAHRARRLPPPPPSRLSCPRPPWCRSPRCRWSAARPSLRCLPRTRPMGATSPPWATPCASPSSATGRRTAGCPSSATRISEPFAEVNPADGKTYIVQYFERNRFEYHPEFAGTPDAVLLGLLGRERDRRAAPSPRSRPFTSDANRRYFPQTGHSLQRGLPALLGQPTAAWPCSATLSPRSSRRSTPPMARSTPSSISSATASSPIPNSPARPTKCCSACSAPPSPSSAASCGERAARSKQRVVRTESKEISWTKHRTILPGGPAAGPLIAIR